MSKYVSPVNQYLKSIDLQEYERYIPNAFDGTLTMLEKVNKVIHQLNENSKLTNDVASKWNDFVDWVNTNEFKEPINNKLNELIMDGTFSNLINTNVMDEFKNEIKQKTNQQLSEKTKLLGTSLNTLDLVKKGMLTIHTDDGYVMDYDYMLPISISENVPFCTAIISNNVGKPGYNSLNQLLELQNDHGWEIMSHTVNHPYLGTLTRQEQEYQLSESKKALLNMGLNVESIALPYGHFNDDTKELSRKYYRSSRSTNHGLYGINYPPIDTYELKMLWMDTNAVIPNDPSGLKVNTFDYYKHYIDKAVETNGWIIILLHSWNTQTANLGPLLKQVIQYAKGKLDIVTHSEALNRFGNILDAGNKVENEPYRPHYTVGYNGEISSNHLLTVYAKTNEFDATHSIDEFQDYKITVNKILTQKAIDTDMPEKLGGTLTTYKLEPGIQPSQTFNYQVFRSLSGNTFTRSCNLNKTWGEWIPGSPSFYNDTPNKYNGTTPITTFKKGLTIHNVNTENASLSNLPEKMGGTLITFKSSDSHGYSWQEYHIYRTNRKYKRHFNDDGTDSLWVSESGSIITIATPWTEIPANTTTSIEVTNNLVTKNNVIQLNPSTDMPNGVFWNVVAKDGKIVIRLTSIRASTTALDPMNWNMVLF